MKISEIIPLFENNRATLFHGTSRNNIIDILSSNVLEARTTSATVNGKRVSGISLSRTYSVSALWGGTHGMVLELDQNKLKANYRIHPRNAVHEPPVF